VNKEANGLPGIGRRLLVIFGYIVLSVAALTLAVLLLSSPDCVLYANCSDGDELAAKIASLIFWMVVAFFALAGWTGRLYGCRKKKDTKD
jgi:hypothetical protein